VGGRHDVAVGETDAKAMSCGCFVGAGAGRSEEMTRTAGIGHGLCGSYGGMGWDGRRNY
jgi:hypothetical protein